MRIRCDGWELLALVSGGVLVGLIFFLLLGAGCVPETDLTGLAPAPDVPGATAASGTLVDPVAGATDVPLNLAAVTVRFPAPVTFGAVALQVCGAAAVAVAEAPSCQGGTCYVVSLEETLPPRTSCRVELGPGAVDARGGPLPGGVVGVFDTAAQADTTPPTLSGVSLQVAGPCVAVTFETDEPATGMVLLRAGGTESVVAAGAGATSFDVAVPVGAFPPDSAATLTARAVDRAGNAAESASIAWQTPGALPALVITEVLANAAGTEPAQELVELLNVGADAVATEGLSLADARGADALPAATIGPGAYALVVTSAYEAQGGADVPPRAGTQLLRVDARLGSDGLSNGGEVVRLLRGDAVVSSYGGWIDVSSVAWAGKSVHRLEPTACDRRDSWNHTPLPATPGAAAP